MAATIACMIATIGRDTLPDAIASAEQFDQVIVIADDTNLGPLPSHVLTARTGRRFDQYGSAAWNVGAYLATCDWVAQLGDDDQWKPGAAEAIRQAIARQPEVGCWIPGLRYNDGHEVCMAPGLEAGNVAAPITRPQTYFATPMTAAHAAHGGLTDHAHIADIAASGVIVGWLGQAVYQVRPRLAGRHGNGQP